ncbi:MAG: extracellular solute-binding protein [Candidatus Nomurabacteria bacterium]|nr:MAG: extracellular solute-binding protein [Candidatus Nomurabacteria bacterium]
MRRYVILIGIVLIPVLAVFIIVSGVINKPQPNVQDVPLTFWTVQDDTSAFTDVIAAYQQAHPYITIEVVQKRAQDYGEALIQAWARGDGPDIFSLPNAEVGEYADFIAPLPEATQVYQYQNKRVLLSRQLVITPVTSSSITPARLSNDYVDVIASDVIRDGQIYALPLSVDTLAVYVNRNLLNTANIVSPATTWQELISQVPDLTIFDAQNNIIQSGIALGTAENVSYSAEILSLLMMQNGTQMTDPTGTRVQFDQGTKEYNAGERAVDFYTDFSDETKAVYSWSGDSSHSIDSFIEGKTAYLIGTLADQATIQEQNPALRYDIVPMFHINTDGTDTSGSTGTRTKINYAKYWVQTVAKNSAHSNEAWNFVQYMSQSGVVEAYLNASGRISPLRKILAQQVNVPALQVFANQALTAQNWYHGNSWTQTEGYLKQLITVVAEKTKLPLEALSQAAKQVQLTFTE